jgi:hypothetical protein
MNQNVVFKRKFRFTLEGTLPGGKLEPFWVRAVTRPTLPNPTEEFHCVVYEMDTTENKEFWKLIQSSLFENVPFAPEDKLGTFKLTMYDGCGQVMETRTVSEAYFSKCLFGDDLPGDTLSFEFYIRYRKLEIFETPGYKALPELCGGMGIGHLVSKQAKCPNCQHEFVV